MKALSALSVSLASLISFSAAGGGYDTGLAKSYAKLFEPAVGAKTGKALHLMKAGQFIKNLQKGKQFVTIDIRTPNEFDIFTMTLPESMSIPVNEVFLPKNLDRIPLDKTVTIVCKSGTRAIAIGTALRHVGFDNVYVLKGGLMALSKYLDAKTANITPKVTLRSAVKTELFSEAIVAKVPPGPVAAVLVDEDAPVGASANTSDEIARMAKSALKESALSPATAAEATSAAPASVIRRHGGAYRSYPSVPAWPVTPVYPVYPRGYAGHKQSTGPFLTVLPDYQR